MSAGLSKSYAFIVPRFGENVGGGAETLAGSLAARLAHRGEQVEVLSTCAIDNRSWENYFPAGETKEGGVIVRRFLVDNRNLERWVPLQIRISEGLELSLDEQLEWMSEGVNSSGLYDFLARESQRFDALFFAPYLFGTTFYGSLVAPERSVLIPCLHDESYAYVDIIQSMFRQVSGALFNALPERDLAFRLYGKVRGGEVGMGFDPYPEADIRDLGPYFEESFPYLLYVGRKETGKNVQLLVDYFSQGKDSGILPANLRLVVVGGGSFSDLFRPGVLQRGDIIDLEQVSEREKLRLIRHAALLCQPSVNESFSIVLMEAWLLSTPVLVHSACAVTRHHVLESGGGLYFRDQADFAAVVRELVSNPALRSELARAGYEYVRRRYDWRTVLERFDRVVTGIARGL